MNSLKQERLMAQGRLAELKHKYSERDLEGKALIASIRNQLDPFETDITNIKAGQVENSADRLLVIVTEMQEMKTQIASLEAALG